MMKDVYQIQVRENRFEAYDTMVIVSSVGEAVDFVYSSMNDGEYMVERPENMESRVLCYTTNTDAEYVISHFKVWFPD